MGHTSCLPFSQEGKPPQEDFFILISRLNGGTNHSHHPRERPLVCPQKASRTPWPPERLSPPPPVTCIGRSKLWKVRAFPLLCSSAKTISTAGCLLIHEVLASRKVLLSSYHPRTPSLLPRYGMVAFPSLLGHRGTWNTLLLRHCLLLFVSP